MVKIFLVAVLALYVQGCAKVAAEEPCAIPDDFTHVCVYYEEDDTHYCVDRAGKIWKVVFDSDKGGTNVQRSNTGYNQPDH